MVSISVITVAYNAAATLGDTLESVRQQSGPRAEHWLIDGGSSDATREVVLRSGGHLAGFVSERDRGLYDAMNKGVARCSGDVVGFLNADDWYAGPDVLAAVAQAFEDGADLVYGDLDFVSPQPPHRVVRRWRDAPHEPGDLLRSGWVPAHPATYIRTALLRELGGFDLRWRIGADFAFLAKALLRPGLRLRHVQQTWINMRVGGASTEGPRAVWRANRECARALGELGVPHPWAVIGRKIARKIPQLWAPRPATDPATADDAVWKPWST